jgi:hypothetical protein
MRRIETPKHHDWRAGPCELCKADECTKARPNPHWREQSMSKMVAMANGIQTDGWPAPCEVCGAECQITPAGRWFVEHAYPHVRPGVFATQPVMTRPEKVRDPLLESGMILG